MINRYKDCSFRGKKIRLILTMGVLLDAEEHFNKAFTDILKNTSKKEAYKNQLWLISAMSYEGYAQASKMGYMPITISELETITPVEFNEVSEAFWNAYTLALTPEEVDEEIDLGLLELKKKKETINSKKLK